MPELKFISPAEWAEKRARENGYTGEWPPRPQKRPANKKELMELAQKAKEGDHRTSVMKGFGLWTNAFYEQITPEEMRGMAATILEAIGISNNTSKAKAAAIESAIGLANDMSRFVPELAKLRQTHLQRHIYGLLMAFMDEIGEDGFKRMAKSLLKSTKDKNLSARLYSIRRLHKMMLKTLEMSMAIEKARPSEPAEDVSEDDPRVIAARQSFLRLKRPQTA